MSSWASRIAAITLFAADLEAVRRFYADVVELPVHFEDPHSVVYDVGGVLINYLVESETEGLMSPVPVAPEGSGVRVLLTIPVDDVHAVAARVVAAGGVVVRGPEVRPWGPTTATLLDPAGHAWEIAS